MQFIPPPPPYFNGPDGRVSNMFPPARNAPGPPPAAARPEPRPVTDRPAPRPVPAVLAAHVRIPAAEGTAIISSRAPANGAVLQPPVAGQRQGRDAFFSAQRSESSAVRLPSWLQSGRTEALDQSGSSADASWAAEDQLGVIGRPAPAQQPDSLADIMSLLMPAAVSQQPELATSGASWEHTAAMSTAVLAATSASEPALASAAVDSMPYGNGSAEASRTPSTAAGVLAHLLNGVQPAPSVALTGAAPSVASAREATPQLRVPAVSLKRQAYNPMQAGRPS